MPSRIFFDVVVEPNRPLSSRGLMLVVGSVGIISFVAGVLFALRGAWPVTPFFGLDVLLLWWAMRASVRASRRRKHLVLTSDLLVIERYSPKGELRREEINPY